MIMQWTRAYWRELLVGLLYVLPTLSLLPLGFLWLIDHHASLPWAGALLLGAGLGRLLIWLRPRAKPEDQPAAPPQADWGPAEQAAWAKVQKFADSAPAMSLTNSDNITDTLHRTIALVARSLHADRTHAIGHFTLPEALTATEALSRALKLQLLENVPLVKQFHISRALWLEQQYDSVAPYKKMLMPAYRLLRLVGNPPMGIVREAAGHVLDKGASVLSGTIQRQITRTVILETGRAAINLYSGRYRLTDSDLQRFIEAERRRLAPSALPRPIRIFVAGQVNAGKSSLINALAGATRAPVHALPTVAGIRRHDIEVEGQPGVSLVELPGLSGAADQHKALIAEALQADFILWVAGAGQPARAADVSALTAMRAALNARLSPPAPPIALAVTQIDQLRPSREWTPPYNITAPDRPKAETIRDAVAAAAAALAVPPVAVVPVAMPNGADPYQIDALWAVITGLLPQAQQTQLNRAIESARSDWNFSEIFRQVYNGGTTLLPGVIDAVSNRISIDDATDLVAKLFRHFTTPAAPQPQDPNAHR